MKDFHLKIFILEVKKQCQFAKYAYHDIHTYLEQSNSDRVWYSIQSFLISTGNISKLLWINPKIQNPRGKEIRDALNYPEDSILSDRSFRDHFEHYDERLERWVLPLDFYIDSNIGKLGQLEIAGITPNSYMRNFDPDNFILTLQNYTYEFKIIYSELIKLLDSINTWEASKF